MDQQTVSVAQFLKAQKFSGQLYSVVMGGAKAANSGFLDATALLRSALAHGKENSSPSAKVLFDSLSQRSGEDRITKFMSQPTVNESANITETNVSLGVQEASQIAWQIREQTGGKDDFLGLRHILFAITVNEGQTRSEVISALSDLGNPNPKQLAADLARHLREWRDDDSESWEAWEAVLAYFDIPNPDDPAAKLFQDGGPATYIASDRWALHDALGFDAYAQAIADFIRHAKSSAPFTVSIQAPWGGGKTTLMRLVQSKLDPDAVDLADKKAEPASKKESSSRGALRVADLLKRLTEWMSAPDLSSPPLELKSPENSEKRTLTIWFNAWKYESTNQVWAGFSQAVLRQVASRLDPRNREKFWFELSLRRIDVDKIRQKIHERVFAYWWRQIHQRLLGFGLAFIVSVSIAVLNAVVTWASTVSWIGATGTAVIGFIESHKLWKKSEQEVRNEPAAAGFGEYLEAPNYPSEVGFVHRAEEDLRKVLESVPEQYHPIVIFIDDLDRCSPAKVAQVVEATNLFLAGDLPKCVFILGMDTEMVAAALEAAHKDMIANLPGDAKIPLGWRFMNKFVQLPFVIPPTGPAELKKYEAALFPVEQELLAKEIIRDLNVEANLADSTTRVAEIVEKFQREHNVPEDAVPGMEALLEQAMTRRKLAEGIKNFDDKNFDVQVAMKLGAEYFGGNPRELKRFVNSFRFQYYLWWARRAQNLSAQLVRWTVLSMKWPEVVRWIRRGGEHVAPSPNDKPGQSMQFRRLSSLQDISAETGDQIEWKRPWSLS